MYIVRWLMGHPIIAIWVLGAVAILLTLGSGKKDVAEAQKTSVVVESSEQQGVQKIESSIASEDEEVTAKKQDDGKNTVSSDSQNKITTVNISTAKKSPDVIEESQGSDVVKEDEIASDNSAEKSDAQPSSVMPENSNSSEKKPAEVTDLGQASTEELLKMAREAYWNNGLDEAAQIYEKLIKLEPKMIEHKGELGNVFWRQGYPKKAAELYSEIAIPMIEAGDSERVANMVGFIGLFYPDRSEVILERIRSEKGQESAQ